MKKTLTEQANAKINLYLRVTGRRPDGYHELYSIMQSVSLADTVTVSCDTETDGQKIKLTCTDPSIPCDGRNIAVKCAESFFAGFGIKNYAADIHIEKRIPVSGGLAGGSTDGAAVLRALNAICGTGASLEKLCSIGARIGADIPFCVIGGTAVCTGIGDVLAPLDIPAPSYSVLIVAPGGGVSTPEAYAAIDSAGVIPLACDAGSVLDALKNGVCPNVMHNDFEAVIFPLNEKAAAIKAVLTDLGADSSMMSGSGPTLFGLFSDEKKCAQAESFLSSKGYKTAICRAI